MQHFAKITDSSTTANTGNTGSSGHDTNTSNSQPQSPIGEKSHASTNGPKGAIYKVKKINKKVRKLALAQTLSKKNKDKQLHILEDVKKEIKKTKDFNKFLVTNKISNVLIVSDKNSEKNFERSARNIKNLKIISDEGANIYDILKYKNLIITSSSIKKIEGRILNEKN